MLYRDHSNYPIGRPFQSGANRTPSRNVSFPLMQTEEEGHWNQAFGLPPD